MFVFAEQITSFVSDITVHEDGSITVIETITYDFKGDRKHGIFRNVSEKHTQPASVWYKERFVDYELISVTRNGVIEPYTIESYPGLSVKIGNPNQTITGEHVYQITYQALGALATYDTGNELYWNVTGDEWQVPILQAVAIVRGEESVELSSQNYCYEGIKGAVSKCLSIKQQNEKVIFTSGLLNSGEQLTIAQKLSLPQGFLIMERYVVILMMSIILTFGLLVLLIAIYRWRTKFKIKRPIVTQYEPYADFKPMFTGVLIDNTLDSRDISAGIVYLAQQGFISIRQIHDKILFLFNSIDYEVTLKRSINEAETHFHEKILHLLFGASGKVGEVVRLSEIKKDRSKLFNNLNIIRYLRTAIKEDLVRQGFLEKHSNINIIQFIVFVPIIFLLVIFSLETFSFRYFLIFILVTITILLMYSFIYMRYTIKGYEALNHLKGFKLFLSVTDKERYKFHNNPNLNPQQFMEYLPYAIAFGVEKEWAEVFKDVQIESPDWYKSDIDSSFDAVAFTAGIANFSTTFASSSGSSGSSGGGSSGGGSGGGGGGSW